MNRFRKTIASFFCVLTFVFVGLSNTVYAAPPAPPVSNVRVVGTYIGQDGYVYVNVSVTGYGKSVYATYDKTQVYVISDELVGDPIVTGAIYTIKCLPAKIGSHVFTFRITSINSPRNTEFISSVIDIK